MNEMFNTLIGNSLMNESMNDYKAMVGFMEFELMVMLPPNGILMGGHPLFGVKELFVNNTNIVQNIYKVNIGNNDVVPTARYSNPITNELPFFISSYITKDEIKKITDKSVIKYINPDK